MTITRFSSEKYKHFVHKRVLQFRSATLILLSTVFFSGVIVTAWFAGEDRISIIFAQIDALQRNPPMWLEVPMVTGRHLLAPIVVLLLTVWAVFKVSPQPHKWSRRLIVVILLILTLRYFSWRSLSTLNLADPLNGVFSLGLFFMEMLTLLGYFIQLLLMLNSTDRREEADAKSEIVTNGEFIPSVDILIPTYNEPAFILQRTIIGCQALEYPNKKIYLLDDTRRPEVKELAESLKCKYITRPDNLYAKAGNLNHAIPLTNSEFIVIFDADFIPTKNFLTRTIGFFVDEKVALVQTPQSFYNSDPIARNLGLENILTANEEVFFRQIQPVRDAAGSVVCSGTSFIVRRSALVESGCFVTESLSEDYFTGIRLSANGYRLVYLDEKLSAGLAAENIAAFAIQQLRWARGTLQAFFIKSNPLTIAGLTFIQRLAHLEGLLHWFNSIARVYLLMMPLAYSFLGILPIRATPAELLYFFLPYYVVNFTAFSWLNKRSRSALLSDIYSLVLCFPLAITAIQVMLNPFTKGFKVTPKGTASDRYIFNWRLASPLIILFVLTAFSLWRNLGMCVVKSAWVTNITLGSTLPIKGLAIGWLWSVYNLFSIGIALLILLDAPKPDVYEWFDLRRVVKLNIGNQTFWGVTSIISEVGAEVALTQSSPVHLVADMPVKLEIMEENLQLDTIVVSTEFKDKFPTLKLRFETISLDQHRSLVEMLYCRPGQWKYQNTPGELDSLLLIFRILLKPRILFERRINVKPVSVNQV